MSIQPFFLPHLDPSKNLQCIGMDPSLPITFVNVFIWKMSFHSFCYSEGLQTLWCQKYLFFFISSFALKLLKLVHVRKLPGLGPFKSFDTNIYVNCRLTILKYQNVMNICIGPWWLVTGNSMNFYFVFLFRLLSRQTVLFWSIAYVRVIITIPDYMRLLIWCSWDLKSHSIYHTGFEEFEL